MKKLSIKLVLFFLASLILYSCNSNLSVTKRRYNKGYYVHHAGKPVQARDNENLKIAREKEATPIYVLPQAAKDKGEINGSVKNIPQENRLISSNVAKPKSRHSEKNVKSKVEDPASFNYMLKNPVKTIRSLPEKLNAADPAGDALSLLWVVIVILLIVYLLSFLFDGFGLGGLVHILGVIILVLLILWLLRIL